MGRGIQGKVPETSRLQGKVYGELKKRDMNPGKGIGIYEKVYIKGYLLLYYGLYIMDQPRLWIGESILVNP